MNRIAVCAAWNYKCQTKVHGSWKHKSSPISSLSTRSVSSLFTTYLLSILCHEYHALVVLHIARITNTGSYLVYMIRMQKEMEQ